MAEPIHHHRLSDGDHRNSTNLEELFDTARTLWDDGELRKSWGVYEHICSLLRPDPVV